MNHGRNNESIEDLCGTGGENGQGSSWEECDELMAGMPTSFSKPRNSSITEFDRQKHMNACQLLSAELNKVAATVPDEAERIVSRVYHCI